MHPETRCELLKDSIHRIHEHIFQTEPDTVGVAKNGAITIIRMIACPNIGRSGKSAKVMERSTHLMPSTSHLEYLFPDQPENAAIKQLLTSRAEVIVIKRGAAGATIARKMNVTISPDTA